MIYRWFVCLLILIKWYLVFMIYRCFVCLHSAPRSSNSSLCTIYYQVHMHKMKIIQLIIDNIVYICLTFLHCVFSNVSKSGHSSSSRGVSEQRSFVANILTYLHIGLLTRHTSPCFDFYTKTSSSSSSSPSSPSSSPITIIIIILLILIIIIIITVCRASAAYTNGGYTFR